MIIEFLKDGKKMLTYKISYATNVSSNTIFISDKSSIIPNTLFDLMKSNILIIGNQNSVNQITTEKSK